MLTFRLNDDFVEQYRERPVPWGFKDAAGNSVGEITFLRTYSRLKDDGSKERWYEVCRRVVEGTFSIQKDHCKANRLPWNDRKAQATAQEMFARMFTFKWTPPGRGLWMMGTPLVNEHKNSAALQNCAFVSTADMTKYDPAGPFAFLLEASMLGVGVGFDTKGADKGFKIYQPDGLVDYEIPDTREGWVDSVKVLIESYLMPGKPVPVFNYDLIRPAGEPIRTFGGTAAGPDPLKALHNHVHQLLSQRAGQALTSLDILDLGNLIGVCVVSGNVRRSAELAIGSIDDKDFLNAKNFGGMLDTSTEVQVIVDATTGERVNLLEVTDEEIQAGLESGTFEIDVQVVSAETYVPGPAAGRSDWGWMSNNSVAVNVGDDLSAVVEGIARNGEPGVIWLDQSRKYGRLIDPPNNKDWRVAGYNPCAEQSLESYEMCTLVETYISRHDDLEDFKRTLKVAYLYAKTVTLLPTHWQRTNAIMQRNRRIGTSMSGIADFADNNGIQQLREWMDQGYATVQSYDATYSEWLCVRESIKTTTVKPSGTVSILAGVSPGTHWGPGGEYFDRGIIFSADDPMVAQLRWAGYKVEDSAYTKGSVFVQFPIHSGAKRSEKDVTLFEKAALAVEAQRYWSDNSVSVTLTFDPETEGQHVGTILKMHDGQLKTVSFLPSGNTTYAQMPYQQIDAAQYEAAEMSLLRMDLSGIYAGGAKDAAGESMCTTDACEIKQVVMNAEQLAVVNVTDVQVA